MRGTGPHGGEGGEEFTPAVTLEGPPQAPEVDSVDEAHLSELYAAYQRIRDQLHTAELQGRHEDAARLKSETLEQAEMLAVQINELYMQSPSLADFEAQVEAFLCSRPMQQDALQMNTDDTAVGAYIMPLSLDDESIPSPAEAIRRSVENLKIIDEFASVGEQHASGLLVSGSNTWGRFYSVRGGVPRELQDVGIDQLDYKEFSDIDFLITAPDVEGLAQVIHDYVEAGLLGPNEVERFAIFKRLHEAGELDMFSVRAHTKGAEESIHFVPQDTLNKMASFERLSSQPRGEYGLDYIRDFRPGNRSVDYTIGELKGLTTTSFMPTSQEVHYGDREEVAGYCYDNPLGGVAEVDGEETYFMGIVPFFLLVTPTVYVDKEGLLSSRIEEYQGNVRAIMNGAEVKFIPRQERMPKYVLDKIKGELS